MSPESIAAILTGVTSLVVAVGSIIVNRNRRVMENVDELRGEVADLRAQVRDAARHIHQLEVLLAGAGIDTPQRPPSLRLIAGGKHDAAS